MSTADDRDPHVKDNDDRLLKRSLAPRDTVPGEPCLDAETLAAWADGAASIDQVEAIERHLAACARCQAVLATFAGTDTDTANAAAVSAAAGTPGTASSNVVPFRSRLTSRWVPIVLGAIAASLVIYAVWPAHRTTEPDRAEQRTARVESSPQVQPQDSRGFGTALETPPARADVVQAERKAPAAVATKSRQAAPVEPAAPQPAPRPLPAPPMPVVATGATAANATIDGVRLATPPPPTTTATPTAAAAKPSELVMLRGASDAALKDPAGSRVVAEFMSPATPTPAVGQSLIGARGAGGAGGGGGGRGGLAATAPRPAPRVNWRVRASGVVERSANGGQTWEPVTITPAATIVGGTAPSANVCWLIGRAGVVLRSTDGLTFRRVNSPDVADLRSIIAIDDLQATVTTTDGRVFKTEDGGDHWVADKN